MNAPEKIGKYEIKRQIGRGAMGAVFEAYDSVIERRVALKLLRVDVFEPGQMADVRARFKREAHSAGRLSHPHIVTIFDYGEHEGTPYIVMDFMQGKELSDLLEGGKRLQIGEVVRVMTQLLGALGYAHESGVVHRDIKPSNIFLLQDGSLKVVDFGVARVEASELTDTGAMIGTPAYMSPEQFLGLPVDARSDIFSCGVILYQLLTGDKPFTGSVTTIMQKVLRQDPVEPSALNPTLDHAWDMVVKRALAKKPEERFLSARQFAEAVRAAQDARSVPAGEPTVMNVKVDLTLPQTEKTYDKTVPMSRTAQAAAASQPGTQPVPAKKEFPFLAVGMSALVAVSVAFAFWAYMRKPAEPVVAVAPAPAVPVPDAGAEARKRAEAEKAAAAEKAKTEAEIRARLEGELRGKLEAEQRAKIEAELKARREAARKAEFAEKLAARKAELQAQAARKAELAAAARQAEAARPAPQAPAAKPAAAKPATPQPVARAPAAPSPYRGKIVKLDRDWGFVVVESYAMGGIRLGDRLVASLANGRQAEITVRRIAGNLVSATPQGQLSDDLLGATVGPK